MGRARPGRIYSGRDILASGGLTHDLDLTCGRCGETAPYSVGTVVVDPDTARERPGE